MDNRGFSPVELVDLNGDVSGVCQEVVYPLRSRNVPSLEIAAPNGHADSSQKRCSATEVSFMHIPDIAHGGMDVRNVERTVRKNSFGYAMAAGDDENIVSQVKRLNDSWE